MLGAVVVAVAVDLAALYVRRPTTVGAVAVVVVVVDLAAVYVRRPTTVVVVLVVVVVVAVDAGVFFCGFDWRLLDFGHWYLSVSD
jgi:hypothetical protein